VIQELTFLVQEIYLALQEKVTRRQCDYAFEWSTALGHQGSSSRSMQAKPALGWSKPSARAGGHWPNVARHSRRKCAGRLQYHADRLEVTISDNGIGFDAGNKRPDLACVQLWRVGSLHGTLQIRSTQDRALSSSCRFQ
jgi:hypothetical protein